MEIKEIKTDSSHAVPKKEKTKPNLRYLRDKDREKVKGIFHFHEVPGGEISFYFRKYKEDPVEKYTLRDGMIYELPLGVAKHLKNNCWYPQHHFEQDKDGKPVARVGKKVHRVSFESLEFTNYEELDGVQSDIITVEHIKQVT